MRKYSLLALFFSFIFFAGYSQNTQQSADDLGRIALVPVVLDNANIPSYASALVKNKLIQAVTQSGLGGTSFDQRFIITANIEEVSKEITPTAPPMVALGLSATLYVGDVVTGNLYSSCRLTIVNGVGTNETKAYISAIKTINMLNPEVKAFIEKGKTRIVEHYNSQIDIIIAEALALTDQEKFDDAISLLFTVPEVCKEAHLKAMHTITDVYQRKIDKEGATLLNTARLVWYANQSSSGANEAASYLSKIHPLSSCFANACNLSSDIAKRIKEIDDREWDFRMKQYENEQKILNKQIDYAHEEQMSLISAAKEVGIVKYSQPITYNYNHIVWW